MHNQELVYKFLQLVPKGQVVTYGEIGRLLDLNPRVIGQILHRNKEPNIYPCYKVVFSDGSLSTSYAFGGKLEQEKRLVNDSVTLHKNKVSKKHFYYPSELLRVYFELLKKHGEPGPWPWFDQDKPHSKDEIIIGSILTQNTNWNNVQKAIDNLRDRELNSLEAIYKFNDLEELKALIRPAGFYNQKIIYLKNISEFLLKQKEIPKRKELLGIKGVGEETADTILLYAYFYPIFIIDRYTKSFYFNRFGIVLNNSKLKEEFSRSLPNKVELYQNYHALIVQEGKKNFHI